jgi:hypothetical protein
MLLKHQEDDEGRCGVPASPTRGDTHGSACRQARPAFGSPPGVPLIAAHSGLRGTSGAPVGWNGRDLVKCGRPDRGRMRLFRSDDFLEAPAAGD